MATDTNFDRLTRTLSSAERANLLKRVKGLDLIADAASAGGSEEERPAASELEQVHLGLLARFVIFVMALFSGKPRGEVLRELAQRRLGEEIAKAAPGLLDQRRSVFLGRARDEIELLSTSTAVFREALRRCLGEEQDEFLAFLAGHLLPHVQERLAGVTDLAARAGDLEVLEIAEARKRVHEDLENAISSVLEEERRSVYAEVRALHLLRGLVLQPFTEMLECFNTDAVPGECGFARLRKYLPALDAQLHALRRPPSPAALEGLFMFAFEEEIGTEGFSLEERLTEELRSATAALTTVRTVDRRVPLTKIVRLVTGNLEYLPRAPGGGEEWFILFRRYWTGRTESELRDLARRKEHARLVEETERYLEVHRLPRLGAEALTGIAQEVAQENELALAFVLGFTQEVFAKLARSFAMLLERARFVKEDNRRELAQVHGYLNDMDARMEAFVASLKADQEMMSPPADVEPRRAVEQRAAKSAQTFLDEAAANIKILSNVLEGILRGSPGGRYDTVFNLDTVGDWQGKMMSEVLEEGYDRIAEGLDLLGKIRIL